MKTTQILALFVCVILIAICEITDAGEKKVVNAENPLPDGIKIVASAKDVPREEEAFSGVLERKWTGDGIDAASVVEK